MPEDAYGMLQLPATYWRRVPQPGGTDVLVRLRPVAITAVDSFHRTVGLELHLSLAWLDDRLLWQDIDWACGDTVTFSTAILG
jgi:hypothetical protein